MTSSADIQYSSGIDPGGTSVVPNGKTSFGKDDVQLCQIFLIIDHLTHGFSRFRRQLRQNSADFILLFHLQFPDFIVHIYDGLRLDK